MTAFVRAVSLTGYVEVTRHLGLEPYALLRRFRIHPDLLANPENRLSAEAVVGLLEETAQLSDCMNFGLRMAECRTYASLGPICLLLEHLATIREVIEALTEYRRHLNDIIVFGLEESEQADALTVQLLPKYAGRQASMLAVAVVQVALAGASRHKWHPLAVHFTHPAPDELHMVRRFFHAPVEFEATFNGFTCSREMIDRRSPWYNETMAGHARHLLDLVKLGPERTPWSASVRRAIMLLLPNGKATLPDVAHSLGTNPRALQRQLAVEGHMFGDLLNDTRRELVRWHLGDPAQSMTNIAQLLGYSAASSFTRWFTSEFDMSPREWRARELGEAPLLFQLRQRTAA